MPQTNYIVSQIDPQGLETYLEKDKAVTQFFEVNNYFDPVRHKVEYHIYSIDGEPLLSDYNYSKTAFLQGSSTAGTAGASQLSVDVIADIKEYGYSEGGVKTVYNFLNDLYSDSKASTRFFIEEISSDRTELRLLTTQLSNEQVVAYTDQIKKKLKDTSYFSEFRINASNNDLFIGININSQTYREYQSVVVKLYEPLPEQYDLKDIITIEEIVSDSVGYEVEATIIPDDIRIPFLKGPNFNVDQQNGNSVIPSQYFNYNELFNYSTQNSYRELNSLFAEKGVELSIDYSDFSEFINFSSANERLRNFKYKLDLIETYQAALDEIEAASNNTSGISGSRDYYKSLINNLLDNFDHYDRHLYYSSGSTSWPKTNNTKPYINATGSATGSWYSEYLISSSNFDSSNNNQLLNTVPTYLREDPDNQPYETFIHMVGQHFDNLWIYTKAVTDKYDNDNRINKGISKDLVEDALRNFGVKLYTSNNSIQSLFKTFTGEFYNTGSEDINTFVTASNSAVSEDLYRKEIYKRLYHNLPLLLKGKGSERGIRALINSFGIPTSYSSGSHTGLNFRVFGGSSTIDSYNLGPEQAYSSSLSKIRLDNTGSIVSGNTLSMNTSIVKRNREYTDDLHNIEIGYSPTDVVNNALLTYLRSDGFNIDNYIGDPRAAYSSSYDTLISSSVSYVNQVFTSDSHNLQSFTRILKFYDNVIFKTVKDFLPARSNTVPGIIIKPHILERSKAKQVSATATQNINNAVAYSFNDNLLLTGSINSGSRSGSHGDAFGSRDQYSTNYSEAVMTPDGKNYVSRHSHEQAKFDGEFSGSLIQPVVSPGELNDENTFKYDNPNSIFYKVNKYYDCTFTVSAGIVTPAPTTPAPSAAPTTAPTAAPTTPAPGTPSPTAAPTTPSPTTPAPATPAPSATPDCYTYSIQNNDLVTTLTFQYTDCSGTPIQDQIVPADSSTPDFCAYSGSVSRQSGTNSWVLTEEATSCTVTPAPTTPAPTAAPTLSLTAITLEYGSVDCTTVCNNYGANSSGTFYMDSSNFYLATTLYANSGSNPAYASANFYTNGTVCRDVGANGALGTAVSCASPTPAPVSYSTFIIRDDGAGGGWIDASTACSSQGSVTVVYTAYGATLQAGTVLYTDSRLRVGIDEFPGNGEYYLDQNADNALLIDASGEITSVTSCATPAPSTPSPTAAPALAPTPSTYYARFVDCTEPAGETISVYSSSPINTSLILSSGGMCYEYLNSTGAGVDGDISTYTTYASCELCAAATPAPSTPSPTTPAPTLSGYDCDGGACVPGTTYATLKECNLNCGDIP